jgi:hypothetical protein
LEDPHFQVVIDFPGGTGQGGLNGRQGQRLALYLTHGKSSGQEASVVQEVGPTAVRRVKVIENHRLGIAAVDDDEAAGCRSLFMPPLDAAVLQQLFQAV